MALYGMITATRAPGSASGSGREMEGLPGLQGELEGPLKKLGQTLNSRKSITWSAVPHALLLVS